MKILITGANGFVGSNLISKLKNEYEVSALVRKKSKVDLIYRKTNIIRSDYSKADLKNILKDFEIVIHLAGATKGKNWNSFYQANYVLTDKISQIAEECDSVKQFIFISSQAAAGLSNNKIPKREIDESNPITFYGKSKLMAENAVIKNCKKTNYTILRPASVYGPGDKDFLIYFKLVKLGLVTTIWKREQYLSLIYVEDLVKAIQISVANKNAFNQKFFISDGKIYRPQDIANSFKKVMNIEKVRDLPIPVFLVIIVAYISEFLSIFTRKISIINRQKIPELIGRFWICDNSKIRKMLNFSSDYDIDEAAKITYEWYKKQGWL